MVVSVNKPADMWFLDPETPTGTGQGPSFFVHLMQNYFLVIVRKDDPAGIAGSCLRCCRGLQVLQCPGCPDWTGRLN